MKHVLSFIARAAWALFILNEIRGVILAVPVMWAMIQTGGSLMAIWVGFCSLAGIALSVVIPWFAARKLMCAFRPQSPAL